MTSPIRQIDWRPEFRAFAPFIDDQSGVVQYRFSGQDCAANHFSTLLKQAFVDRKGNCPRFSIRIDHDFASTHTTNDTLDEFEVQLRRVGIEVKNDMSANNLTLLTENDVTGDMDVSIGAIVQNFASQPDRISLSKRVESIRDAIDHFVAGNGRFMIEFRDRPIEGQTSFWRDIWAPLLSRFEKGGLVFVHMLGPLCLQQAHEDAPAPNWTKTLPTGFSSDETRQDHAYDDLIDVFVGEGETSDVASARASTLLDSNLDSVVGLHSSLAAVLMNLKTRTGSGS